MVKSTNTRHLLEFSMENQRVRLSKRLLKDAFIELLSHKPLSKVTIKEICEKAQVNRTTFYKHYTDEYSLLMEIEQEYLDVLVGNLCTEANRLDKFLTSLFENPILTRILVLGDTQTSFFGKMFKMPMMKELLTKKSSINIDADNQEKAHLFIFSGVVSLVIDWVGNDFYASPIELAKTIRHIVAPMVR